MNNRFLQVLSVKPFLFLWLAEVFSQVAMNIGNFVLIIVAYKLSSSNTAVSGIVLSFTVPAILFGMLAGVYVDRWNKKKVLLVTNLLRTLLLIALSFYHKDLLFLYAVSFIASIVTQFFIPAETPIIPRLVPKKLLLSANALFGMGIYGSIFVAYALSGPLLIFLGDTNVFLLLAGFFALAGLFVSFIRVSKKHVEQPKLSASFAITPFSEMQKALAVMVKTKEIYHSLFLLTLSQILILILAVIGPGYASSILHIKVEDFPLLFVTPSTIGMVVGAIFLGNFFNPKHKGYSATFGVFLAGISMFLLPYASKEAALLIAFVLGIANALVFVPSNTILQEKTSEELRGKVYGTLGSLVGIFSLLPIIIIGQLADVFGVGRVITGIAAAILLIGIMRLLFHLKIV